MKNSHTELNEERIGKLLLRYSVPATIGMMVNSLYNLVDAIFIGQGVGTLALGALAIAFPIQMIILAIATAVGIGSASSISRFLGANDQEKANRVAGNSFIMILLLGIIVTTLGLYYIKPLVRLFGSTDEIMPYAVDYLVIILSGTIFAAFAISSNSLVRAEGKAKTAMVSMLLGAGLNIILDPIFIFGFGMGIRGAAIATVTAFISSAIFLIIHFVRGSGLLKIKLHHIRLNLPITMEVSKIGASSLVRVASASLLAIALNNSVAYYGDNLHLAIVGAANRLIVFTFLPLIGIVQGLQPIIGFNYGAHNMQRVKRALMLSIKVASFYATSIFIVLMIFAEPMLAMFSSDQNLIQEGGSILRILVLLMPFIGFQVIGASMFQALGKAGPAMLLNMSRQLLFLVPLILILPLFFQLSGIWYAYPASDLLATLLTFFWVLREIRLLDNHQPANELNVSEA